MTGTFAGLPQGATFLAGGQLFAISYIGGTGNDIVVTRTGGADRPEHADQRRRGSTLPCHRLESHVQHAGQFQRDRRGVHSR